MIAGPQSKEPAIRYAGPLKYFEIEIKKNKYMKINNEQYYIGL